MENVTTYNPSNDQPAVTGAYQTDAISHGIGNSSVSSNWWSRPDDQRFLSLDEMLEYKKHDAHQMTNRIVDTHKMKIVGDFNEENPWAAGKIHIEYTDENGRENLNAPTNWSFGQISQLAGAPAGYLRELPAPLAAEALQWGLRFNRSKDMIKIYGGQPDGSDLRAATGPDYGRIFDYEIIEAVQKFADPDRWKVPGMMTGQQNGRAIYDPFVPVTKDTTTLFASDRDIFLFLVDDTHPLEIGKLPNGDPDLVFRGFYAWNSETGSKTAGIAAMYLRGVCMNRNLWGVEKFQEIKIRHTKFAPDRFAYEAAPALQSFANGATVDFMDGIRAAQNTKIASDDDDAIAFLTGRGGLSKFMAKAAAARHLEEEQKPVRSAWDAAQAITAIARDNPHQNSRVDIERKAGAILDAVAA